jgi:hypothetical protein
MSPRMGDLFPPGVDEAFAPTDWSIFQGVCSPILRGQLSFLKVNKRGPSLSPPDGNAWMARVLVRSPLPRGSAFSA